MRFICKPKPCPRLGDTRIVNRFLLFPLRLGNKRRWLERASIKQEYSFYEYVDEDEKNYIWQDIEWVNQ